MASELVKAFFTLTKRIKPLGFQGLSLFTVGRFFLDGLKQGALSTRAAAVAFRFFLAFFPGIIVLLSLIPIIPVEDFQSNLFSAIEGFLPGDTFNLFESTIEDLIHNTHTEVLSLSFILGLFFASNSINAILLGFSGSINIDEKGGFLKTRLFSLGILLIMTITVVISMALITASESIFEFASENYGIQPGIGQLAFSATRYLIIILLIYSTVTLLYNVGNLDVKRFKYWSAGASLTTLFFILTTVGFAIYLNNFGKYNELYGTLGTLVVLLIWLNFNCLILLLGFELNASISQAGSRTDIILENKEE